MVLSDWSSQPLRLSSRHICTLLIAQHKHSIQINHDISSIEYFLSFFLIWWTLTHNYQIGSTEMSYIASKNISLIEDLLLPMRWRKNVRGMKLNAYNLRCVDTFLKLMLFPWCCLWNRRRSLSHGSFLVLFNTISWACNSFFKQSFLNRHVPCATRHHFMLGQEILKHVSHHKRRDCNLIFSSDKYNVPKHLWEAMVYLLIN